MLVCHMQGCGKILEVLALILSNAAPSEVSSGAVAYTQSSTRHCPVLGSLLRIEDFKCALCRIL